MPINQRELLQAVSQISELQSMRVTIRQSGKWGLITGAAVFGEDYCQFKSVAEVLMNDLTTHSSKNLLTRLRRAVQDVDIQDAAVLLPFIMNNDVVKQQLLRVVTNFITTEMRMMLT
ncbi:uncharacterized protein LOC113383638 [Ctenocephalides felis]|uniref:uncharacterized protein LOC113383638 n=1 Tax=Ctenocephalides felis TaxID=7515 RepID=UPI000E6E30A4|nr:uncharacterized protein LOC113383638 [Ctenocephalides felis]